MWLVRSSQTPAVSRADLELLALLATGMPAPRVARTLAVSDRTIRRRVRSICDAIGVGTTIEAVAWAARRRLI
ncbi:helix-turn-helix transcriptional regulator [Jiangella asiatica]|uniref:Helix-turn-helix transcriptional regulator n=2 Tax=Jiangella asiatica TaxID=2530372 RepID=A0A4R5D6E1_9ACTN|nr:helix-turn-helix transcriptional regulator [Jiangella asiatica]